MPEAITAPAATTTKPAASPNAAPPAQPSGTGDVLYDSTEIDSLDDNGGAPPPEKPKEEKPVEVIKPDVLENEDPAPKPKTADEEIEGMDEDENGKPKEAAKPEEKPKEEERFARTKDLKIAYENAKAELKTLKPQYEAAQKEIATLKTANPDEIKVLRERLEKAEARRTELEQEVQYVNYSSSEEFQTKFRKPYEEAWQRANQDINEITVALEDGSNRKATIDDLMEIANMPLGDASKRAKELFGDLAPEMLTHRRIIRDLSEKQNRAMQDAKKTAGEKEKERQMRAREINERVQKVWAQEHEALTSKYPKWFKPVDGDTEGNELLDKGFQEVDQFFNDPNIKPDDRAKMHVRLRAKAANHDRLALRLKRAMTRIQKMNEDLAAYRNNEPPAGKTNGSRAGTVSKDPFERGFDEIQAMDEPE